MSHYKDVILITGGAGFIGTNLVKSLVDLGNSIIVVDNFSSGYKHNVTDNIVLIEGNLQDESVLNLAFSYSPSYVFHLAALFANQNSVDNPLDDLDTNGRATLMLLECCVQHNVKKIVYTSSSCVYGNMLRRMSENTIGNLETPYAITKLLGEQYLSFYADQYGLESVAIRVFNTFGPFDYPGVYRSVVPNYFQTALDGESLPIYGDGESLRCYMYIDDLVQGLIKSMKVQLPEKFTIINLGNDSPVSSFELGVMINNIVNNKSEMRMVVDRNWDKIKSRVPDLQKSSHLLGWKPNVELYDGLAMYHEWLIS